MKSNKLKPAPKQRNLLHNHPLMRKCSTHDGAKKQNRSMSKINFKKDIVNYSMSILNSIYRLINDLSRCSSIGRAQHCQC